MTKQQKQAYQDVEKLKKIIQNLKGRKYKLSCGHHVTMGSFLGSDIIILNGIDPQIICTQCGY